MITHYPRHPVNAAMVDASVEAGIPFDPDCNDGDPNGVGFAQLHIRDGRRETPRPRSSTRLPVPSVCALITGMTATGLRFDGERCVGVGVDTATHGRSGPRAR